MPLRFTYQSDISEHQCFHALSNTLLSTAALESKDRAFRGVQQVLCYLQVDFYWLTTVFLSGQRRNTNLW